MFKTNIVESYFVCTLLMHECIQIKLIERLSRQRYIREGNLVEHNNEYNVNETLLENGPTLLIQNANASQLVELGLS